MENNRMNDFNKILLVGIFVLLSIQLFTNYNNKDIGRYKIHQYARDLSPFHTILLIDTKDGHIYRPNAKYFEVEQIMLYDGTDEKNNKKMKWEMAVEKEDIDHKVVEKEGIDYNATNSIH